MKKIIALSLVLMLVMTSFVVVSAASTTDSTSSATTEDTSIPAAPTTPSQPAAATTTVSVPAGAGTYTVVGGDTMAKIAAKHGMTLDALLALNPQVANKNLIFVGQKIVVKAGSTAAAATSSTSAAAKKVYEGLGSTTVFRNGPGSDSTGTPVYSFTIATARATFDGQGRIIDCYLDAYEVATPNYDGASMPHFSGWPGTAGYNVTDHTTGQVTGVSTNTVDSATAEVNGWLSKRQRGDSYEMNPANEWYKQMDFYQNFFKGKTIAQIDGWFAKYTTTAGRPIKANTTNADDLAKYNKLTDAEKADLADVVSGATMSLRDVHGDYIGALEKAYQNRHEVTIN